MLHDQPPQPKHNQSLEGIRGLAAAAVLWAHLVDKLPGAFNWMGVGAPILWTANLGTEAVALFFLLSGFVIGVSTSAKTKPKGFLIRRGIRILPIYWLALVLSICVANWVSDEPLALGNILGHFLFLQTLQAELTGVISSNQPLWSLSFEIYFYVMFAFTLLWKSKAWVVWIILLVGGLATFPLHSSSGALNQIAYQSAFSGIWLVGFILARTGHRYSFSGFSATWIAGLALPLARTDYIAGEYFDVWRLSFCTLCFAPAFNYLTSNSSKIISLRWWQLLGLWVAACSGVILTDSMNTVKIAAVSAAPILLLIRCLMHLSGVTITKTLACFSWAGGISYAVYVFHFPILILTLEYGSQLSWPMQCVWIIATTLIVSYFLERIIQPLFSKWARRKWLD